jgi:putative spermidine/putrescine transport system ATP-binding protein
VQMRAEIRRIQGETGLTVVLVTHDQDEALEMSDDMVLMRAGRIMQQGSPQHVFPNPANRFVADFLGYENFVTAADGTLLAIRPEHLGVTPETPAGGAAHDGLHLAGVVSDVAYRGVDLLVTVQAVDATGAEVRLLSDVRSTGSETVAIGDRVTVTAPASRLVALVD